MLALRESEGFRPRHPLPRPAEHAGPSPSSFANLQTFQHSNFLTLPQTIPFRIHTYEKHPRNPFRIRTSKTQDLKPFGMNTYKGNNIVDESEGFADHVVVEREKNDFSLE
jgi:hypothetical protein